MDRADQIDSRIYLEERTNGRSERPTATTMVSYSAWVTIRPFVFRTVVALLAWTTVLVGLIAHGLNIFLHLSWWAFVSLALYETCTVLSFGVRGVFAAVCMVYAPFATIAY